MIPFINSSADRAAVIIPFLGKLDASSISPAFFTVILAALDSINPVAFFVLSFLLGLLIHEKSRSRILLIGGTFVFFSGFIYFLFIAAWLNVFLFAGHLRIITLSAGVAALVVGVINIKGYFTGGDEENILISDRPSNSVMARITRLLHSKRTFPLLAGASLLAIAVNAYEMVSSLGFPLVFTRGLTLFKLSTVDYYSYLLLYCIVYVIPLAGIVLVFVISLGARSVHNWQGKSLNLTSGFMMFGLGVVLVFKPDLLNGIMAPAGLLAIAIAATAIVVFLMNNVNPDGEKGKEP
jgi:hypothetical protein